MILASDSPVKMLHLLEIGRIMALYSAMSSLFSNKSSDQCVDVADLSAASRRGALNRKTPYPS
jgi:hypothetical protein